MEIIIDKYNLNRAISENKDKYNTFCSIINYTDSSLHSVPSKRSINIEKYLNLNEREKLRESSHLVLIGENLDYNKPAQHLFSNLKLNEFPSLNLKLDFYRSIEDFIVNYAPLVQYINEDWIFTNLDYTSIGESVVNYLNSFNQFKIQNWLKLFTDSKVSNYTILSYNHLHDGNESRTICELSKNLYKINLPIEAELEIQTIHGSKKVITTEYFAHLTLEIITCDKRIIDLQISCIKLLSPIYEHPDLSIY
ncbi:hypothetical protein [Pedobacter sp. B4-66]|uniref:hypothetical protein n=1 Tax=Pedobacter sp. B4-66 TaxID=2817280 RepID=UPI001BD9B8A2|nr:hypothetical protein [Pedobacter sp. B4-66]